MTTSPVFSGGAPVTLQDAVIAPVPENYLPILLFIAIGIVLGTLTLYVGKFVRPNQPYRAKLAPYESGSPLFQDARV